MKRRETVFVGLSGGVDSSVAALRLQRQGYDVVGVFIKVWHPDFMVCNWEAERLDAMRAAATLNIPFLTCDAEHEYREKVAEHFISEYTKGRTPNPDILCNQAVKFGCFFDFAMARGADYVATGHYVQRIGHELHRGVDPAKDQSYFLWTLPREKLERCLFPVGNSEKNDIRTEAVQAGLPTATKNDSQGICFLGHVDIPEFLSHYVSLEAGNVLDTSGAAIGTHKGALVYTLGQRHGFAIDKPGISRTPMYVTATDMTENTITVDTAPLVTKTPTVLRLSETVLREPVTAGAVLSAQFRYRQEPFTVTIEAVDQSQVSLRIPEAIQVPASGQSCVLYHDTVCIGGGIITR